MADEDLEVNDVVDAPLIQPTPPPVPPVAATVPIEPSASTHGNGHNQPRAAPASPGLQRVSVESSINATRGSDAIEMRAWGDGNGASPHMNDFGSSKVQRSSVEPTEAASPERILAHEAKEEKKHQHMVEKKATTEKLSNFVVVLSVAAVAGLAVFVGIAHEGKTSVQQRCPAVTSSSSSSLAPSSTSGSTSSGRGFSAQEATTTAASDSSSGGANWWSGSFDFAAYPQLAASRQWVSNEAALKTLHKTYYPSLVRNDTIKAWMQEYSRVPHMAGTSRNSIDLANRTAAYYRGFGFDDVRIESFPVVLSELLSRSVDLLNADGSSAYSCALDEPNLLNSSEYQTALRTCNAYSGNGTVVGPIVWANYGREEDFAKISNINLTGTIVVVRYGAIFRGNKVSLAASRGAIGVLIAMEPKDTGDMLGKNVLPYAPWSTNRTVQRGSVYPGHGDPATSSWPSEEGGPRLSNAQLLKLAAGKGSNPMLFSDAIALPNIPVQPIGYGDARRLLQNLGGQPMPAEWQNTGFNVADSNAGTTGMQGFIGPSTTVQVRLSVSRKLVTKTINNVVATIYGSVEPDRSIILASHRDSWTYGAVDPISGHSTILEVGRVLGALHQPAGSSLSPSVTIESVPFPSPPLGIGWRPRRTIELCSWDGEEFAIIGSIEYVEKYVEQLRQRAVAYINLDTAVTGTDRFAVGGSPHFWPLLQELMGSTPLPSADGTAAGVSAFTQPSYPYGFPIVPPSTSPQNTTSSSSTSTASTTMPATTASTSAAPSSTAVPSLSTIGVSQLNPIGSGSDFVGFIQLAGVPSIDAGFYSLDGRYESVYHTNYDTVYWVEHFCDPFYKYHQLTAQVIGQVVLALADRTVLPLDLGAYGTSVRRWVSDIQSQANSATTVGAPGYVDFNYMNAAVDALVASSATYQSQVERLKANATLSDAVLQLVWPYAVPALPAAAIVPTAAPTTATTTTTTTSSTAPTTTATPIPTTTAAPGLWKGYNLSMIPVVDPMVLRRYNDALMGFERNFLAFTQAETGQTWYKHVLYTPSAVNEYGSTTMPLMTDAINAYTASLSSTSNITQQQALLNASNFAVKRIAQFIKRSSAYLTSAGVGPLP